MDRTHQEEMQECTIPDFFLFVLDQLNMRNLIFHVNGQFVFSAVFASQEFFIGIFGHIAGC